MNFSALAVLKTSEERPKTNATMMNVPPEKKRDVHGADCDSDIRTIVVVRASTLDTPKH